MTNSARGPAQRSLAFAVQAMGATWLGPARSAATFAGAAFDSRAVRPGQLFFALPGERVDGFDYCVSAAVAGASAVVVAAARGIPPGLDPAVGIISVADPLAALGDLARAVRAQFTGRVVGVTGSNGKTTTRELCAAALGAAGAVMRTDGNYNTEIGLPLTILGASGATVYGEGGDPLNPEDARPSIVRS